jgi:3-hydroxyisobutyrate dehydrogenase-like beta-hydroxyacid dehydrogenase
MSRGVLMMGLGRMGLPIATRLLNAGVQLHVHDLDEGAVARCTALGATAASHDAVAALDYDLVLLCLPTPAVVDQWIAPWRSTQRTERTVIADFTTASPEDARRNEQALQAANIGYLDCPLSGGEAGARSGKLVIAAGGAHDDYLRTEPLLGKIGNVVRHVGPSGAGNLVKAINQSVYLAYNYVFAKAVEFGVQRGMDADAVMELLARGAAGHPLINDRLLPEEGRQSSGTFALERAYKDLSFLEFEPSETGGTAEIHAILVREFGAAVARGDGKLDIFSLARTGD